MIRLAFAFQTPPCMKCATLRLHFILSLPDLGEGYTCGYYESVVIEQLSLHRVEAAAKGVACSSAPSSITNEWRFFAFPSLLIEKVVPSFFSRICFANPTLLRWRGGSASAARRGGVASQHPSFATPSVAGRGLIREGLFLTLVPSP